MLNFPYCLSADDKKNCDVSLATGVTSEDCRNNRVTSNAQTEEDISLGKPSTILIAGAHEGKGNSHIDKYIPAIAEAGYSITFIGWDRKRKFPKAYQENNVSYKFIFRGFGYVGKSLMFVLPVWCVWLFFYLLFQKPDLIMAIDLECAFPASLAKIFRHIPTIYAIRDTYALRPTVPRLLRRPIQAVDNWVMKRVDKIIVPDENRILESYEDKEKFTVIYNCCRDLSNSVPPERKDRTGKPFTVLATGRLLKNRGVELLLRASECLPDVHILMAGYILEKDLQDMVDSNPRVNFLGRVPLDDAYRLCFDADVVFTFYDPSSEINRRAASNKWADAMMASRPILVNSGLVKAEWIRKNDIGYLCPYGDVKALVRCLEHIRDNPGEAKQKGQKGRKLYEEGYNWETMEVRLWELLNSLVEQN